METKKQQKWSRKTYLTFSVIWFILFFVLATVVQIREYHRIGLWGCFIIDIIALEFGTRRCHDFNCTGWLGILAAMPVLNFVIGVIPGTDGDNKYGSTP